MVPRGAHMAPQASKMLPVACNHRQHKEFAGMTPFYRQPVTLPRWLHAERTSPECSKRSRVSAVREKTVLPKSTEAQFLETARHRDVLMPGKEVLRTTEIVKKQLVLLGFLDISCF